MEKTQNHETILLQLGELKGMVNGINQRLDVSNGRIAKNEEKIATNRSEIDKANGAVKLFSWIWGAVIAFGGLLLAAVEFYLVSHK